MRTKKLLSIIISLCIVLSCISANVFSSEIGTDGKNYAYITLSKYGQILSDKDGKPIAETAFEWDRGETKTLDDLFLSLNKDYCMSGADGYESDVGEYGSYVKKFWNDDSGNFGYQVNGGNELVMDLSYRLKDNDFVDVCIYENTYPLTEAYSKFEDLRKSTECGADVEVKLLVAGYDEDWNMVFSPCEDADITINGEETGIKTDTNGIAVLQFDNMGEYIVSAVKQKTVSEEQKTAITAPICKIKVSENKNEIAGEIIKNIIEKYCGANITEDVNMPWFYADLGLYCDVFGVTKRNIKTDTASVDLLIDAAEKSSAPSELAKIIIALRANHYDVKNAVTKEGKSLNIAKKLLDLVDSENEKVTEPYTLPYVIIALKDYMSQDEIDYLLEAAIDTKEYWQDTEFGTDGITPMLIALSQYRTDFSIEELIDESVAKINECQNESGYIDSFGPASSTGLAIAGLSAIDIDSDEIKKIERSLMDGLLEFATEERDGFVPTDNSFSSEQGLRGLLAYKAYKDGIKIYDFSDKNLKELKATPAPKKSSGDTGGGGPSTLPSTYKPEVKDTEKQDKKEEEKITEKAPHSFKDVEKEDWFYDAVQYVYDNKLMQGVDDNNFCPYENISRAMLVTILYRMENSPNCIYENTFIDVAKNEWYSQAVAFAYANKIILGTSENEFSPNEDVTREQFAVILKRYTEYRYKKMLESDCDISGFSDFSEISDYALDSAAWAVESGLLIGTDDGKFLPKNSTTRAEAAVILQRYLNREF